MIGVLIVGLLAAYAGHTYRVTRLPYCDNGVVPANAWWPGAGRRPAMRAMDANTDSDGRCRKADVIGAGALQNASRALGARRARTAWPSATTP